MKNNPKPMHDMNTSTLTAPQSNPAVALPPAARHVFMLGLDVGASLKKKMAVALARQLAIDVWRWRTGRATAAELGWTLNAPGAETATG